MTADTSAGAVSHLSTDWHSINWKAANETVRRLMVNEHLARAAATTPPAMTKWLYKDVLHADLDDPYLGLGKMLFDGYVFDKEDRP